MNLTEAAQAVLTFCERDGVFLSEDLTQVEEAVLTAVRRIGAKAVELRMARQKLGYEGPRRPCSCGQAQHFAIVDADGLGGGSHRIEADVHDQHRRIQRPKTFQRLTVLFRGDVLQR